MSDPIVVVDEPQNIVIVQPVTPNIVVTTPGPQGPAGTFNVGSVSFTYYQTPASSTWTIDHNLGFKPVAVVIDSAGTNCEGSISYPNNNTMVITFNSAFEGTAYLV